MADIQATCPHCGKTVTVSQFVRLENIPCRGCGKPLAGNATPTATPTVTASAWNVPNPAPVDSPLAPIGVQTVAAKVKLTPPRFRLPHQIITWSIFAVIAIVFALLTFVIAPDFMQSWLDPYAWLVLTAIWLYVSIRAFADSILNGALCLLVPGYVFYYLFLIWDDYMARAVFGGVLAGGVAWFGVPVMVEQAMRILPNLDEFLNRGLY